MTAKWVHGGCLAAVLGLTPVVAFGQEAPRAALSYDAGPGCPDEAAFRTRIAARALVTFDSRADRAISVTVASTTPSRGTLAWTKRGAPIVREVSGATCDEVASALALIAAVLLEQSAADGEGSPAAAASEAPPEPPPAPPSTTPTPPPASPDAPLRPSQPPPPLPESEGGRTATVRFAVGGHLAATSGVGPALAAGGRLFAEASIDMATQPAVRLSLAWYPGTDLQTDVGTVQFSLLAGRFEACPLRLAAGSFSAFPCGVLDVGRLAADATQAGGGSEARLHLAPGALLRLAWSASDIVALELEGGPGFPLDHYWFFFDPKPHVYDVPAVTASGGAGVSVRFP